MANCTKCQKELTCDEIGLHKKLMGRAEEEFMCISCLASFFKCEEELLHKKIKHFKNLGCRLFSSANEK